MNIPVQRPFLGQEELTAVRDVLASGWLGMGAKVQAFENALKDLLDAKHVVAVNSGTSALHLALDLLDLVPGDEVIVPTLTFVATPQAVVMTGAKPVFCDVEEQTFNLDPSDALRRMTPHTRAIIPVHYGGTPCDMEALLRIAADRNVRIVEDAAHAFGSTYRGKMIGAVGDLTCFSFDPIKNVTCGEGGAIATNDSELAAKAARRRVLGIDVDTWRRRSTGRPWCYDVAEHGFRYHLSDVNAAIGLEQLKRFEAFKARRQAIARRYDEAFAGLPGLMLRQQHLSDTCPFFYVIRVRRGRRNDLMEYLKHRGINSGVHYIPNHLHRAFSQPGLSLPVAERLYEEILTLPLFYEMTDEQVETVIAAVRRFFAGVSVPVVSMAQSPIAARTESLAVAQSEVSQRE